VAVRSKKAPSASSTRKQIPRRLTHARMQSEPTSKSSRKFNYDLNYKELDLRKTPNLYRVGVGEQGVLLVEPYKSEILPLWRFKTPTEAQKSAKEIFALFKSYAKKGDFVGMDMARKFLQMGFTRSRRYANHKSGQKYDKKGQLLPFQNDPEKAKSAELFKAAWQKAEVHPTYALAKKDWKERFG
jgi:hypothetical protein